MSFEAEAFRIVRRFARERNRALARKIVHFFQREKATGIYGGDLRTQWDEICHEWQEGGDEGIRDEWVATITPHLDRVLGALPHSEQLLLSAAALDEADDYGGGNGEISVVPDLMRGAVMNALVRLAMARTLGLLNAW